MKKAIIFDPYLDTLGGGERYTLTFAQVLLKKGWRVDVFWDEPSVVKKAAERFGLETEGVNILPKSKLFQKNLLKRFFFQRKYDLLFWVSDGSVPLMFTKKNLLHFQVPFHNLKHSLGEKLRLALVDEVICNSFFTKRVIDREYGVKGRVLYPPVSVQDFSPGRKRNIILAVGRFEETMQAKRQDVLVTVFKEMVDEGLKNWRLVLAGASLSEEADNLFLEKLKKSAAGYPVDFRVNVSFNQLKSYYSQAKIFWHAAGFGVDEEKHPEKVEHFGMTTIEAMAAGCWPLVYSAGGQKEIFAKFPQKDLVLWKTKKELSKKTVKAIKLLKERKLQYNELVRWSCKFSVDSFSQNVWKII